jgi:hypothetical protein
VLEASGATIDPVKAILFEDPESRSIPPFGASGDLIIDERGIQWSPGWLARRRRRPSLRMPWESITGAELLARGRGSRMLVVQASGGEVNLLIGDLEADRAGEEVARFLETR